MKKLFPLPFSILRNHLIWLLIISFLFGFVFTQNQKEMNFLSIVPSAFIGVIFGLVRYAEISVVYLFNQKKRNPGMFLLALFYTFFSYCSIQIIVDYLFCVIKLENFFPTDKVISLLRNNPIYKLQIDNWVICVNLALLGLVAFVIFKHKEKEITNKNTSS